MKTYIIIGAVSFTLATSACATTDLQSLASSVTDTLPVSLNVEQTPEQAERQALLEKATIDFSDSDQKLDDAVKQYSKSATIAEGAVIGAVVAGGAAAVAGGDGQIIGLAATAGGVAGAWVGDKIGNRIEKIIADRTTLDAYIAKTKASHMYAQTTLSTLEFSIEEVRAKIASLAEKRKAGRVDLIELQANRAAIEDHLSNITKASEETEKNLASGLAVLSQVSAEASQSENPEVVEGVQLVDIEKQEGERLQEIAVALKSSVSQVSADVQDNLI